MTSKQRDPNQPAAADTFFPGMVEEWERFLSVDHADPEDIFKTAMLFPLQRQAEWRRMIAIAQMVNPTTVMEIGADKGGGVWGWLRMLPNLKRMVACEVRGTPYSRTFMRHFPGVEFQWVEQSSYDPSTVTYLRQWLGFSPGFRHPPTPIDVLFIDGDKGGMLKDFDAYRPLMNPAGVVFLHDVREHGPRIDWETIKARGYRTEHILDISDTEAALAREAKGIPPGNAHEQWLRHWRGWSCSVGVVYLDGREV